MGLPGNAKMRRGCLSSSPKIGLLRTGPDRFIRSFLKNPNINPDIKMTVYETFLSPYEVGDLISRTSQRDQSNL